MNETIPLELVGKDVKVKAVVTFERGDRRVAEIRKVRIVNNYALVSILGRVRRIVLTHLVSTDEDGTVLYASRQSSIHARY